MDHLIGAIDYHEWADVCCWYNSAIKSGFRGRIVLFVYEHTSDRCLQILKRKRIEVISCASERSVNHDRFLKIAEYCKALPPSDRVLTTDVRDVAFQGSIHKLLEKNLVASRVFIASEGWRYRDSAWNRNHVATHFPWMGSQLDDEVVYCCGVLGADAEAMADTSRTVYEICRQAIGFAGDQAAWNHVLRSEDWKEHTLFLSIASGMIGHFGPLDRNFRNEFVANAVEAPPRYSYASRELVSPDGSPFFVFHQYTRNSLIRFLTLWKFSSLTSFYGGKFLSSLMQKLNLGPRWVPYWKS